MREYLTPDFDVTVYEIEDIITVSINNGEGNLDGGNETGGSGGWWGQV